MKKLGIKEGQRLAFPGAPEGFRELLGEIPAGAEVRERTRGPLDVIVFFTRSRAELRRRMPALRRAMGPADIARDLGHANTLVDNKVCAIDETWSGLRLVIRLRDR